MSRLIAIDTSTPLASLALVDNGTAILELEAQSQRSHNSLLFEPLGRLLDEANTDLDGILIGLGPGSYTGVRIGIAAALGVAMSRDLPLYSLPTVHSLAEDEEKIAIVGDARRGKFYHAVVDPDSPRFDPIVGSRDEIFDLVSQSQEKGHKIWSLDESTLDLLEEGTIQLASSPCATRLSQAHRRLSSEGLLESTKPSPTPVYLQAPFTTTPKKQPPPSTNGK